MSRTNAHAPWVARILDPACTVEVHDHRRGGCDLPSRRDFAASASPWREFTCRFELSRAALEGFCGCTMCTGQDWRRLERRADRRRVRQQLRDGRFEQAQAPADLGWW